MYIYIYIFNLYFKSVIPRVVQNVVHDVNLIWQMPVFTRQYGTFYFWLASLCLKVFIYDRRQRQSTSNRTLKKQLCQQQTTTGLKPKARGELLFLLSCQESVTFQLWSPLYQMKETRPVARREDSDYQFMSQCGCLKPDIKKKKKKTQTR